jgi:hypothetical protein
MLCGQTYVYVKFLLRQTSKYLNHPTDCKNTCFIPYLHIHVYTNLHRGHINDKVIFISHVYMYTNVHIYSKHILYIKYKVVYTFIYACTHMYAH